LYQETGLSENELRRFCLGSTDALGKGIVKQGAIVKVRIKRMIDEASEALEWTKKKVLSWFK